MDTPSRAHRAGTVLTLGILGLTPGIGILPFGIPAWVMAAGDLKAMKSGRMDPSGRGRTQAALVCGIVATGIWVLGMTALAVLWSGRDAIPY